MASNEIYTRDKTFILVMGPTGGGKSTFINLLSDSGVKASNSSASCTQDVQWAKEFTLDGRIVQLVDTPGFDDTVRGEADILKTISETLKEHYEQGKKFHGVIYLHRISDNRMTYGSMRSFTLFRKICGENT